MHTNHPAANSPLLDERFKQNSLGATRSTPKIETAHHIRVIRLAAHLDSGKQQIWTARKGLCSTKVRTLKMNRLVSCSLFDPINHFKRFCARKSIAAIAAAKGHPISERHESDSCLIAFSNPEDLQVMHAPYRPETTFNSNFSLLLNSILL